MKKEFIRIVSPLSVFIALVLDGASIWLTAFVINNLISGKTDGMLIAFGVMVIFALIISFLFTKEIISNGIIFYDDRCEFNALDNDNVIYYKDIESIEKYKDTKASLKKNFSDRHSLIIFNLKNDMVHTVDIGLSTKRTLNKIITELNEYIVKND